MSYRRLLAFVGVFEVVVQWTLAQTSSVTCAPTYQWAFNSLNQSPCEVAAQLRRVCAAGPFNVDPLGPGAQYPPPTRANANKCDCSTVVYNLVSACADCQSKTFTSWSVWRAACEVFFNGSFPFPVPTGTFVPRWAFMDVLTTDNYSATNARAAQTIQGIPDNSTSTSTSEPVSTQLPPPPPADPLGAFGPSKTSKTSNVIGAIIAIVGGLFVFTVVGGMVIKQNRRRVYATSEPPDTEYGKTSTIMSEQYYNNAPPNVSRSSTIREGPEEMDIRPIRPLPTIPRTRVGSMSKSPSAISFQEVGVSRQPSNSALSRPRGQAL